MAYFDTLDVVRSPHDGTEWQIVSTTTGGRALSHTLKAVNSGERMQIDENEMLRKGWRVVTRNNPNNMYARSTS